MKVVREIIHPNCRITILYWNNRYLLKFEQGLLEQTFKVDATEFAGEDDVIALIDPLFISDVLAVFDRMHLAVDGAFTRSSS